MKTVIKASDLIQTLKNAKTIGTAKDFLTELQSLRDSFIESQGKKMLMIEIDTDEDFSIEEKMFMSVKFLLKKMKVNIRLFFVTLMH